MNPPGATTNTNPPTRNEHANATKITSKIRAKYQGTAKWYDLLDAKWERIYRKHIRPVIIPPVNGTALEVGVGTGRNLKYYNPAVCSKLTAVDISGEMLAKAKSRGVPGGLNVDFVEADATRLGESIPTGAYDWYVSTFLYCVLPDEVQQLALDEMVRTLKQDGRFVLVEMVYSKKWWRRAKQRMFDPFVRYMYGARFNRQTLKLLESRDDVQITNASFIVGDTYLLIEGRKLAPSTKLSQ